MSEIRFQIMIPLHHSVIWSWAIYVKHGVSDSCHFQCKKMLIIWYVSFLHILLRHFIFLQWKYMVKAPGVKASMINLHVRCSGINSDIWDASITILVQYCRLYRNIVESPVKYWALWTMKLKWLSRDFALLVPRPVYSGERGWCHNCW